MHVAGGGQIAREVDRVKLAARGAQTAADALVEIDRRRAAAEAAVRFDLDLLFGERQAQVRERRARLARLEARTLPRRIVERMSR